MPEILFRNFFHIKKLLFLPSILYEIVLFPRVAWYSLTTFLAIELVTCGFISLAFLFPLMFGSRVSCSSD